MSTNNTARLFCSFEEGEIEEGEITSDEEDQVTKEVAAAVGYRPDGVDAARVTIAAGIQGDGSGANASEVSSVSKNRLSWLPVSFLSSVS